jgi:hypothetical protein
MQHHGYGQKMDDNDDDDEHQQDNKKMGERMTYSIGGAMSRIIGRGRGES